MCPKIRWVLNSWWWAAGSWSGHALPLRLRLRLRGRPIRRRHPQGPTVAFITARTHLTCIRHLALCSSVPAGSGMPGHGNAKAERAGARRTVERSVTTQWNQLNAAAGSIGPAGCCTRAHDLGYYRPHVRTTIQLPTCLVGHSTVPRCHCRSRNRVRLRSSPVLYVRHGPVVYRFSISPRTYTLHRPPNKVQAWSLFTLPLHVLSSGFFTKPKPCMLFTTPYLFGWGSLLLC
jgi:hypothetical protein